MFRLIRFEYQFDIFGSFLARRFALDNTDVIAATPMSQSNEFIDNRRRLWTDKSNERVSQKCPLTIWIVNKSQIVFATIMNEKDRRLFVTLSPVWFHRQPLAEDVIRANRTDLRLLVVRYYRYPDLSN